MLLPLLVLLACAEPVGAPAAPTPAEAAPVDHVAGLRAGLDRARGRLGEGDRVAAAALVRAAYREHLEPLEPRLRAQDPQGTLELEYGFGVLAARVEDRRSGVDLPGEGAALVRRVEELLAAAAAAEAAAAQSASGSSGSKSP